MGWLVLIVLLTLGVGLVVLGRRTLTAEIGTADTEPTDAETQRAAVELHAIRQRLNIALTRIDLTREADRLRRELADEMRRIELLEAMDRSRE